MVFATLIFANVLLSYANRSFHYSILESFKNRNLLLVGISIAVLLFLALILYVAPVAQFFAVTALSGYELGIALSVAAASVLWFEVYKLIGRIVRAKKD
nr:cation-translocating P-type ATPase C-terminal domain-containing protein [Sphingobacterium siyangense]